MLKFKVDCDFNIVFLGLRVGEDRDHMEIVSLVNPGLETLWSVADRSAVAALIHQLAIVVRDSTDRGMDRKSKSD